MTTYRQEETSPKMTEADEINALATLCEGVGHPMRMSILVALRKQKKMRGAELREAVSALYMPVEAGDLQFHLFKMQMCGIISVRKEGKNSVIELEQDVLVRSKRIR